jgi:hypothetical protein
VSGLDVRFDIGKAVRDAQRAFEEFGADRLPRAI